MSLTDRAVQDLVTMIRGRRWGEGDRLPPEAELATELGVSRGSLREAVRQLSFAGVLKVRQGDGTYVSSLEPDLVLAPFRLAVGLSGSDTLVELYGVRRILEPAATALAVTQLVPDDLATLDHLLTAMEQAGEPEEFVSADAEFHDLIARRTGNEALRALLEALRTEAAGTLIGRARAEVDATTHTIDEHRAILDALQRRDPELARAAATMHLAAGEHWLRHAVRDGEAAR